jgi:hypothetical protein
MLEALQFHTPWMLTLYSGGMIFSKEETIKQLPTTTRLHFANQYTSMILGYS